MGTCSFLFSHVWVSCIVLLLIVPKDNLKCDKWEAKFYFMDETLRPGKENNLFGHIITQGKGWNSGSIPPCWRNEMMVSDNRGRDRKS